MMSDRTQRLDQRQQMITSNVDDERSLVNQQEKFAQELLSGLGNVLNHADDALEDLQGKEDMVGSAIVRKCQELADATGQLATELEQQSNDDRRQMAQACLMDAQSRRNYKDNALLAQQNLQQEQQQSFAMMEPTNEEDMMAALGVAASLLRDVESAFRSIERQEADEIADAALTLARLFVASLQSIHESWTPQELVAAASSRGNTEYASSNRNACGVTIEELELSEEEESSPSDTDNTNGEVFQKSKRIILRRRHRQRVLWPPIGPAVSEAFQWGHESAMKSPILSVALGLTLWPAAIGTLLVGGPIVLADGAIQHIYSKFQNGPIISNLEQGAGQLMQATKLSLLCTRLAAKQALRVVSRQVDRHGGIGKIAQDVGGTAVHHALHPIQTVGMAWDGVAWTIGMVTDTAQTLLDQNFNQERRAALELQ